MQDDGGNGGGVIEDKKGNDIIIPKEYNYIGVFLTFACNLKCHYCINREKGSKPNYKALTGAAWVEALNRIQTRTDLPITLQGGEPTLHPDFYQIVNGVHKWINIDLLTNCQFDVEEFTRCLPLSRLKRDAPYASIRVSYHPSTMSLSNTIDKVGYLKELGYSIGVWIVDYPGDKLIKRYKEAFTDAGIDCRLKEYLDGKEHGTYKYMDMQGKKDVLCRPSELLIAPDGSVYRCHGDLYGNRKPIGNILDEHFEPARDFLQCKKVACNSCDIKVKTDRFQKYGHCAVEIKSG
jgi:MoaA/NifB/PqqE/SkfB family radical SAM enzyme